MDYIIVRGKSDSFLSFEQSVNEFLDDGYDVAGGVCIIGAKSVYGTDGEEFIAQAMIKRDKC